MYRLFSLPYFSRRSKAVETKVDQAETKSLAEPESWLLDLFGAAPINSGAVVTASTAMTVPAVRAAVLAIAEGLGQLPVHTHQRGADGSKERAPNHPAYRLLHDEANDWTPASEFRQQITLDALLHGDGLAFVNIVDGRPTELLRLTPGTVQPKLSDSGEPFYETVTGPNLGRVFRRENILHIRAPSLDGVSGESPIRQCREAIGLALVMERHAARIFSNGARPGGLLRFPATTKLDSGTVARIKASWQNAHGGTNSGGTAVLEAGGEFQQLALNSVDAQFLELRQFAISEIARVFRVPPIMLQDYGRATWSNSEEMGRQFLTFTLLPWIKRWEGEIRLKLFQPEERETYFAEFLTDDLARADLESRMSSYSAAIAARILSPNEARAAENRAPYDGGDRFENPNTSTSGVTL